MNVGDLAVGDRFRLPLSDEIREGTVIAQGEGSTVVKYAAPGRVRFDTEDGRHVSFEGRAAPTAISPYTEVEPIERARQPDWNRDGLRLPMTGARWAS